jgi:hypothetical protein
MRGGFLACLPLLLHPVSTALRNLKPRWTAVDTWPGMLMQHGLTLAETVTRCCW